MSRRKPKYEQEELEEKKEEESFVTFNKGVKLTPKQARMASLILKNKITFVSAPAGVAKTFVACWAAAKLLEAGTVSKVIITKPTEQISGSQLGYLPGPLDDKLGVYIESFNDAFETILEYNSYRQLVSSKDIEYKPVQYVRGRTFKNSIVIVDEMQNFQLDALMALLTRIGKENCKMVLIGDIKQNDIHKKYVAINTVRALLEGLPGVAIFDEFTLQEDNMRDPLVTMILERFEKLEAEGALTPTKNNT